MNIDFIKTKKLTFPVIISILLLIIFLITTKYFIGQINGKKCLVIRNVYYEIGNTVYIESDDGLTSFFATILAKPKDSFLIDNEQQIFKINNETIKVEFDQKERNDMKLKTLNGTLPEVTFLVIPQNTEITFSVFLNHMFINKEYIKGKKLFCLQID